MRNVILSLVAVSVVFAGCATFDRPNIRWARDNNVSYMVVRVPLGDWDNVSASFGVKYPNQHPCFFVPPNIIYVKSGEFRKGPSYEFSIFTSYEDYCLDHEVGHMREYLEGVPYHSKYAY